MKPDAERTHSRHRSGHGYRRTAAKPPPKSDAERTHSRPRRPTFADPEKPGIPNIR